MKYTLSKFRAEESLAAITKKKYLRGPMTIAPDLAFHGKGAEDLTLHGMDIDEVLERMKEAGSLNLADVGAFLLAGPLGAAVTKGYSFGGLYGAATRKSRTALKGKLDIARERFVDVTVASLLDIFDRARQFTGRPECTPFYTGSVPHPR